MAPCPYGYYGYFQPPAQSLYRFQPEVRGHSFVYTGPTQFPAAALPLIKKSLMAAPFKITTTRPAAREREEPAGKIKPGVEQAQPAVACGVEDRVFFRVDVNRDYYVKLYSQN